MQLPLGNMPFRKSLSFNFHEAPCLHVTPLSDGKEREEIEPFLFILLLAPCFMAPPKFMASTQCH
jgi:hypothetical protein